MTSTDHLLSPVVDLGPLSEEEARELTHQIAHALAVAWDKVVEAYQRRVWEPLGYESWDTYCRAELGSTRLRLPAEDRDEAVRSLRSAGLSTRAIAAATGVSQRTAARQASREPNGSGANANTQPGPAVTGLDGKSYPGSRVDELVEAEFVDDGPPAAAGSSGSRRRALPEQAREAGWAIRRAAERVVRVVGDDRLLANKQQVSTALRAHLLFVAQAVQAALGELSDHSGNDE